MVMVIVFENKHLIDNIQIHDCEFVGYSYDYIKRQVSISCRNIFEKRITDLIFENVIFLQLQSCSFWHGGNAIMWMDTCDWGEHLVNLSKQADGCTDSYLSQGIQYFAIELTINSGDTLLIVCERLIHLESPLM